MRVTPVLHAKNREGRRAPSRCVASLAERRACRFMGLRDAVRLGRVEKASWRRRDLS